MVRGRPRRGDPGRKAYLCSDWIVEKDPVRNDKEFELDDDVDLTSPFLRGMLSDKQLVPDNRDAVVPSITTANVGAEMRNREPSEDDWENV